MAAKRFSSRPTAMGNRVAASTPHLLATKAALDVMAAGGNAVDGAVAAAASCTVVQPFTSSVAGVGWALVYVPGAAPEVLEFTGAVPATLPLDEVHADASGLVDRIRLERDGRALLGALAPSVVLGWEALLRRHGRLSLARVLEPAIALATEGFPVSELLAETFVRNTDRLAGWNSTTDIFFVGGRPLRAAERLVQADLGRTLSRIAARGAAELQTGETASAITDFFAAHGGCLTHDDLARMTVNWLPPLSTTFHGHTVYAAGGPLGDVTFLAGLQILNRFPVFPDPLDPDYVHVSIESAKLVAADRIRALGFDSPPEVVAELLSPEHTSALVDAIKWNASCGPDNADGHTITLAVVDEEGRAVNLMQTVGLQFGTGAVIAGTGMFANNSATFSYPRGTGANRIVPGQKVEQNPCLAMVVAPDGALRYVVGSPGGKARVETVRQMLVNLLDHGMTLQQAVDAPRFLRSPDGTKVLFELRYGPDIDPSLRHELEARGHLVEVVDELFASGQVVGIDPTSGARLAAADWRRESIALAE